jgi:hypothetical protein
MGAIIKELIRFIRNPYSFTTVHKPVTVKQKLHLTTQLWGINFLILIYAFLVSIILRQVGINIISNRTIEDNCFFELLLGIVYAPLFEELVFRLPLSFRKKDLFIACFVLSGMLTIKLGKRMDSEAEKTLVCFGILFLTTIFCLILDRLKNLPVDKLKDKYGKYIVLADMIIFACIHITNVSNFEAHLLPVYIIRVFPQFCFAVSVSYCRIYLGFRYGVLLHMAWNVLPVLSMSL